MSRVWGVVSLLALLVGGYCAVADGAGAEPADGAHSAGSWDKLVDVLLGAPPAEDLEADVTACETAALAEIPLAPSLMNFRAGASLYVSAMYGSDETGDGSAEYPLATITAAMQAATIYTMYSAANIYVGYGIYNEKISFVPNVRLVGEGTNSTLVDAPIEADGDAAVVAARNTVMENVFVTLNTIDSTYRAALLYINNVNMRVRNCYFSGSPYANTVGAVVIGKRSSHSKFSNCIFSALDTALEGHNSAARVYGCQFYGFMNEAVLVAPPLRPCAGPVLTFRLGNGLFPNLTGHNVFRSATGNFVVNLTATPVRAQNNDWGVYTRRAIAQRMRGRVIFVPFVR